MTRKELDEKCRLDTLLPTKLVTRISLLLPNLFGDCWTSFPVGRHQIWRRCERPPSWSCSFESVTGLLALVDETPVGLLMLNECAAIYAGGRFGEISELYVEPEFRSDGVAAKLIEDAVRLGQGRNWNRLEVGAPDQPVWKRTFDFYLRNGFAEVGPRLRKLI